MRTWVPPHFRRKLIVAISTTHTAIRWYTFLDDLAVASSKQRTYLAHSQKHVSRLDKRTNVTTWFNRRNDRKRHALSIDMPNYLLPTSDKRASVSHIPAK